MSLGEKRITETLKKKTLPRERYGAMSGCHCRFHCRCRCLVICLGAMFGGRDGDTATRSGTRRCLKN